MSTAYRKYLGIWVGIIALLMVQPVLAQSASEQRNEETEKSVGGGGGGEGGGKKKKKTKKKGRGRLQTPPYR
jgi:hypothetical protein